MFENCCSPTFLIILQLLYKLFASSKMRPDHFCFPLFSSMFITNPQFLDGYKFRLFISSNTSIKMNGSKSRDTSPAQQTMLLMTCGHFQVFEYGAAMEILERWSLREYRRLCEVNKPHTIFSFHNFFSEKKPKRERTHGSWAAVHFSQLERAKKLFMRYGN